MTKHIPAVGDLYRSRDRCELMRIERLAGGLAHCVYANVRRPRRFTLPIWYFSSPACGWRLADAEVLQYRPQ